MSSLVAVMAGDGVGQEITQQALRVLEALSLDLEFVHVPVGGAAYEAHGHPLPPDTIAAAKEAQAILFGAVGDWKYDQLERHLDRKSTRLNSSHVAISYDGFCLKEKNKTIYTYNHNTISYYVYIV